MSCEVMDGMVGYQIWMIWEGCCYCTVIICCKLLINICFSSSHNKQHKGGWRPGFISNMNNLRMLNKLDKPMNLNAAIGLPHLEGIPHCLGGWSWMLLLHRKNEDWLQLIKTDFYLYDCINININTSINKLYILLPMKYASKYTL